MAVAEVQTADTAYGTARTITFGAAPTEGNLLVAYSHHRSGAADATISGTGWTKVLERDIQTGDATFRRGEVVFAKFAGASETATIDIDWSGGIASQMQVREFSGVEGAIEDIVSASNDNATTANAEAIATGTTAAIDGNVLNVAFLGIKKNADAPQNSFADLTFGTGWDAAEDHVDLVTHAMHLASSWIEVADTGNTGQSASISWTWDIDSNNNGLHAAILSIPVTAGGGGATPMIGGMTLLGVGS